MSRLRIVLAAVFAVGMLAVLAVPASASVPAANAKFCKAANKIGTSDSGQPTKSQAAKTKQGFKTAAKYAPKKVKSAMNNIAKYLGLVAGADSAADLAKLYTSSGFKNYSKSITTYVTYYAQQCSGATS
jgi:hypothetical protein